MGLYDDELERLLRVVHEQQKIEDMMREQQKLDQMVREQRRLEEWRRVDDAILEERRRQEAIAAAGLRDFPLALDVHQRLDLLRGLLPAFMAEQELRRLAAERPALEPMLSTQLMRDFYLTRAKLELAERQRAAISGPMLAAMQLQQLLPPTLLTGAAGVGQFSQIERDLLWPLTSITDAAARLLQRPEVDELTAFRELDPGFPGNLVYTATRAVVGAVSDAADESALRQTEDEPTEKLLQGAAAEIVARLEQVDRQLVVVYRGILDRVDAKGPDWVRHFSVSARLLLEALVDELAPEGDVAAHFQPLMDAMDAQEQAKLKSNNEWTRRAQMRYVTRALRDDDFQKMIDGMIEITLALFFPTNAGVHMLRPTLNELQARSILHQLDASINILLTALGN